MSGCGGAREYWRDEEMNFIESKPFSPPCLTLFHKPWAVALHLHIHAPSKPNRNFNPQSHQNTTKIHDKTAPVLI